MDWFFFCERVTNAIWETIKPIIGTNAAASKVIRNGKKTKRIDVLAEDIVIKWLKKENISVTLISEEVGELKIGSNPKYTVVLDPIDGTTNSIKALPFFSTSIGIAQGDKIQDLIFGYVRNYLTGEVFYVNQEGAYLNERKCVSSPCTYLGRALISLYSYNYVNFYLIKKILRKIRKMRLFGAVSIELTYVGCNKLDGLIDLRGDLSITDIAAGILFLQKAGGVVSDANGDIISGKLDLKKGYSLIAAGNRELHKKILKLLKQ
ncbi:MAG: inositol monophosphatase family protein [Candidatus Helarchaeota archaeon]